MTSRYVERSRRNAAVLGISAVSLGLLFLYPTSTNHGGAHRKPGQPLASPGVVTDVGKAPPTAGAPLVVNGVSVDTQYGPVQVQLRISAGRIVSAKAIDYPQGSGRDREINNYAIPVLQRETVRAQSEQVDTVSGATFTSDGYLRSLQSALDSAHLR